MPKVILICGKICSGKTTYARQLLRRGNAVLLSCDEITLALFGGDAGEQHDDYVCRTQRYLLNKALEVLEAGVDVILDWGFWLREEREEAKCFFESRGIPCELHAIDIRESVWLAQLEKRNADVLAGTTSAYFVDEGLAGKFAAIYEPPRAEEIDLWIGRELL